MSANISLFHSTEKPFNSLWYNVSNILNKYSFIFVLVNAESFFLILSQQISDLIIIDFNVWAPYKKFLIFVTLILNNFENVSEWARNYSSFSRIKWIRTHHRVCFTTTSLSVSKYSSVKTLSNWFHKMKSRFFINSLLRNLMWIYCIISKVFHCIPIIRTSLINRDWVFLSKDLKDVCAFVVYLLLVKRTHTNYDLNAFTIFGFAFLILRHWFYEF
jgi:hypothetical protein